MGTGNPRNFFAQTLSHSNKVIPNKTPQAITTIYVCRVCIKLIYYTYCGVLVINNNVLHYKADIALSGQYSNVILNSLPLYILKHVGIP